MLQIFGRIMNTLASVVHDDISTGIHFRDIWSTNVVWDLHLAAHSATTGRSRGSACWDMSRPGTRKTSNMPNFSNAWKNRPSHSPERSILGKIAWYLNQKQICFVLNGYALNLMIQIIKSQCYFAKHFGHIKGICKFLLLIYHSLISE